MSIATPSFDRVKPLNIMRGTSSPKKEPGHISVEDPEFQEMVAELGRVEGSEKVELLFRIATGYSKKNLPLAEDYARRAVELAVQIEDKSGETKAYNCLGIILARQGEYRTAVACFEKGLAYRHQIRDLRSVAIAHINIGTAYMELGDYKRSEKHYRMSLDIAKNNAFSLQYANALTNLSSMYQRQRDYLNSLKHQIEALRIYEALGDEIGPHYVPGALVNIGLVYDNLGDFRKALEYQLKAYEIQERNQDRHGLVLSANNIANLYVRLGNYEQSLIFREKVLQLARELGDRHKICVSLLPT